MRKAAVKHPIAWSVVIVVLFLVSMLLGSLLLAFAPPFFYLNGDFVMQFVAESVLSLCGILLVLIFGYGHIWNQTENFGKGLISGGYLIIVSVLAGLSGITLEFYDEVKEVVVVPPLEPLWKIAIFALTMFLIGLAEESFFRGIIANMFWDKHAKDPAGVWTATIYSGLIFALMHAINLLSSEPGGVLVQMTGVIAMGMAFTAIYYRCKNIWVTIFLHAFLDFCALLPEGLCGGSISGEIGSYEPITAITSTVPYLIVTLVLLRKKKVVQMLAGDNAIGAIPQVQPDGQLVMSVDIPSSPESKKSRTKAIVIAVIIWVLLFTGCIALSDDFQTELNSALSGLNSELNGRVLDITNSGKWSGEQTFGMQYSFTVDKTGNYQISVLSNPSDPKAYVLVQIKLGEETVFESNYGGFCSEGFIKELDEGEYLLNLVYDYSRVTDSEAEYSTTVIIF